MKDKNLRMGITVGIVALLIGVAVAPCINADVEHLSVNKELVEITTEICGLNGIKKHTIELSKEDVRELNNLLNDIQGRINKSKTREETITIFEDAVVSLDELGLLPIGINVEEIQRLVTSGHLDLKCMENVYDINRRQNENLFCLIAGRTNNTNFEGVGARSIIKIIILFDELIKWAYEHSFLIFVAFVKSFISLIFPWVWILFSVFSNLINPMPIGCTVGLGEEGYMPDKGRIFDPACGWVFTIGLNGIKKWKGAFWGNLPILFIYYFFTFFHSGILGFTGLKLFFHGEHFYLGSALWVKIGPEPPGK